MQRHTTDCSEYPSQIVTAVFQTLEEELEKSDKEYITIKHEKQQLVIETSDQELIGYIQSKLSSLMIQELKVLYEEKPENTRNSISKDEIETLIEKTKHGELLSPT